MKREPNKGACICCSEDIDGQPTIVDGDPWCKPCSDEMADEERRFWAANREDVLGL